MSRLLHLAFVLGAAHAVGCERSSQPPIEQRGASPNASILPVPLSAAPIALPENTPATPTNVGAVARPESSARTGTRDGGGPAIAVRADQPIDPDTITSRDVAGIILRGEWRYPDPMPATKAPEVGAAAIDMLRKATQLAWTIDLAAVGRMRIVFSSRGFPLTRGSEIRGRVDRYGHVLVFPALDTYRVLPPGAVRTLLEERRIDAIPLMHPSTSGPVDAGRRLGFPVTKREAATRAGRIVLEQAKIAAAGDGGPILCRLFAELIAVDPASAPCPSDEVVLRAQLSWPTGSGIVFEVTSVNERPELTFSQLAVPPVSASFAATGLPTSETELSPDELASLRTRPIDLGPPPPGAPSHGLAVVNGSDVLHALWLDGVAAAWVAPGEERLLLPLLRGKYFVEWRSFFGDSVEPARPVDVPTRTGLKTTPDANLHERDARPR